MSGKFNWWRQGKVYGRKTLDYRYEFELPDRAEKWLQRAEQRQMQVRQRPREYRSTTVSSSHAQP